MIANAGLFLVVFGSLTWAAAGVFVAWFMRGLLLQQEDRYMELVRDAYSRVKAPEKVPLDPNKVRPAYPDVPSVLNEQAAYPDTEAALRGGTWMGG